MLTDKRQRFVQEYCVDFNATQAAKRAGYSADTAGSIGFDLLQIPEVKESIEERKKDIAAAVGLTPEWILRKWIELANADPADLACVKIVNCRYCNGYDYNYQWTQNEYREALDKALAAGKAAPDGMGGFDFNPNGKVHPDCPECGGDGLNKVSVTDTSEVKGYGRKLFAGVKQTKDGIEIKTRDQDAALANLSKYLGMSLERKELSGPGGNAIVLANLKAEDLDDEQLAALIGMEAADDNKA